eukprot:GAFH01000762.1.p2 GENE.GAFH01000762.1~~GAFH01000762.1.p2  ORF type:complete len:958 (-),score=487.53 GAFH01000762.1:395-3268(-)
MQGKSKFFAASSDDDDDSKSASSEEGSQEEQPEQPQNTGANAFFKKFHLEDSDDDEPVKRVVKSARDKRFSEMEDCADKIRGKMKINDWNFICDEFEKLNKALQKARAIVSREGVPRVYIRVCAELEDFVKRTNDDAEAKSKLNKINAKAFNTMKQRVKKNNQQYTQQIEDYRKAPDQPEEEEEGDEEASGEEEEGDEEERKSPVLAAPTRAGKDEDEDEDDEEEKPKKGGKKDEENSDDDGGFFMRAAPAPSKDVDWSDEEMPESKPAAKPQAQSRAASWFKSAEPSKKAAAQEESASEDEGFQTAGKRKGKGKGEKPAVPETAAAAPAPSAAAPAAEEKAQPAAPAVWNEESYAKRLKEILANRGKKGINPLDQIAALEELLARSTSPAQSLEVLIHIVSAQFDTGAQPNAAHMPIPIWKQCQQNLIRMVATFEANYPRLQLYEQDESEQQTAVTSLEQKSDGVQRVQVGLYPFLLRLDNEFVRSLQAIDPHTQDYVARLQDENLLLDAFERVQSHYVKLGLQLLTARVAALRMEHLYYKKILAPADVLVTLASPVYRSADEPTKQRATLWQVYHLALVDRYYEARDMLLMSHLSDTIPLLAQPGPGATPSESDIALQILYNRTLVQLGMAAFRAGLITEAHSALSDICSNSRIRELLAQGIARFVERTPEQEKIERRRMLPYHMHINLDLVECLHLVSAVLLEVPNMAAQPLPDPKKKVISKALRRRLEESEKAAFAGPPENMRETVVAAARCMLDGDWKRASELILGLPAWSMLPHPEEVKAMVSRKVQEEGMRTYLLQASAFYDGLAIDRLVAMFEMEPARAHALASKMMINEEIRASWDSTSATILFHRLEPSRLQQLALQLAEKCSVLVENNEKLLEVKLGGPRVDQKSQRDKDSWMERPAGDKRPDRMPRDRMPDRDRDRMGRFAGRQGPSIAQRYDSHSTRRPQFTRF